LRALAGERWFADRCHDPGLSMLEEERSWNRAIASAGLDGPNREVVAVDLDQQVGVEFRRKEFNVHDLVLVFVFAVILFFDLRDLSFRMSGLSLCTHPKT
jgi:hypothetical protein